MSLTATVQAAAIPSAEHSILDAAEQLFSEKGFSAASINEIARLAGASKASVFHRFGSKKGLYLAVPDRVCLRAITGLFLGGGDGDPGARLAHFAASHLQGLLDNDRATRLILRGMTEADPGEGRELARQVLADYFERVVALVSAVCSLVEQGVAWVGRRRSGAAASSQSAS